MMHRKQKGTIRSLVRICRRLRLPLPRHDHSMERGPWLTPMKREKLYDRLLANGNITQKTHDEQVGCLIESNQ